MHLVLVGLGVKSGDISVGALEEIKNCKRVLLRTENTLSAAFLKENGIDYYALDDFYVKSRNFDTLSEKIVKLIKGYLKDDESVCYLVDGAVSEDRCAVKLKKRFKDAVVFEGVSKVRSALSLLGVAATGYCAYSAYDIDDFKRYSFPLAIYDLDSVLLASEWKLKLFSVVGEEADAALFAHGRVTKMPLYEIDRKDVFDYSSVLVVFDRPLAQKQRFDFFDIMDILRVLRSPDGCPWDKVQTPESIRINVVEEAYELVDAIDKKDDDKIKEEAGDVVLQAAFHILFAEERGAFTDGDVLSALGEKLVSRHTHVFGKDNAKDAASALNVWNKNKQTEKGYADVTAYVDDVPKSFPALLRCQKVVKRAISSNFDVYTDEQLKAYLTEKIGAGNFEDGGFILFAVTYLLKKYGADPEQDLADFLKKYIAKLSAVEKALKERGESLSSADGAFIKKLYDEN